MEEKILTLHPTKGKTGRNVEKQKYDLMKKIITASLKKKQLTFTQICGIAEKKLKGKFSANIPWHLETVKLDLEARKIIERIPKTKPQKYKLV